MDDLIEGLADPESREATMHHLKALGAAALPELRRGLEHSDSNVRRYSARLLDHQVLDAAILDRLGQLAVTEVNENARKVILHTLSCDACKPEGCDPAVSERITDVLLDRMVNDRSRHVRRFAASCLVHRPRRDAPRVRSALLIAVEQDPSTRVRSMLTPMRTRWGWISPEAPQAG